MATNKATQGNCIKLAKLYKMSADGINIFPKLPTMLKSYYNRWEMNQKIKAVEESISNDTRELLQNLWKSSSSGSDNLNPEWASFVMGKHGKNLKQNTQRTFTM